LKTNIFRNCYEQPENKLTYGFLSLLEHLDIRVSERLLFASGVPAGPYERLHVELLYGGGETNPDGCIVLESRSDEIRIFFENKTWRRRLDMEQIRRHISVHLANSAQRRLLVVTAEANDRRDLDALKDSRIHFMTWHDIAESAEILSRTVRGPKDQFLLGEFQEYLETSGEAWRAKMLDSKLLKAHAQFLENFPDEDRFLKECWRLTDALRDDIRRSFDNEIKSVSTEKHWGRVGNECSLRQAPLGQWVFWGVYYDPQDHKIKFKAPFQAEFAVFFDIGKEHRDRLRKASSISNAISELKGKGFEFNFPDNECGNAWRMCYWRESMNQYERAGLEKLRTMFEMQLRTLFASDFYKIAGNQT
jgi:hypothetical protein